MSGNRNALVAPPGLVDCRLCPRLVDYREAVARRSRSGGRYWSRPVPPFGDPTARLLIVGLAPGAEGANRTGRPFTGDAAGEVLYPTLHRFGFADRGTSTARDDRLHLVDCVITNAVHCVPPDNRPSLSEFVACLPHLINEIATLPDLRVVVLLGQGAASQFARFLKQRGDIPTLGSLPFGHGRVHELGCGLTVIGSYHPSRYNLNTGRLTPGMFDDVFAEIRARLPPRR
ncbi:MAG: uracil-DNA glycosylase [Nitrospirota bacterium]